MSDRQVIIKKGGGGNDRPLTMSERFASIHKEKSSTQNDESRGVRKQEKTGGDRDSRGGRGRGNEIVNARLSYLKLDDFLFKL